jgi:polysaccharide pyruvyl transferase WcaK-like protein
MEATGRPLLVGLSLRESDNFGSSEMTRLVKALDDALPKEAVVLLLPLQRELDQAHLETFAQMWRKCGRVAENFASVSLDKPSQWISLIEQLDLVIGMRLHAVIMALKSNVPVVGLAYDPKVIHVLAEFEQPILNLGQKDDDTNRDDWTKIIQVTLAHRSDLSQKASQKKELAKNLARQNFVSLSRILDMQSDH